MMDLDYFDDVDDCLELEFWEEGMIPEDWLGTDCRCGEYWQ
jgi:hypothetical protein